VVEHASHAAAPDGTKPMTAAPIHASVHEAIKHRVRSQLGRRWPVGTLLPPIRELARELDAGETSTYRAMRDLAAEGLLVSRRGQGTYVMRAAAADDALTRASAAEPRHALVTIAFARETPDGFLRAIADAIESDLLGHGLQTRRCFINTSEQSFPDDTPGDAIVAINPGPIPLHVRDDQVLLVISTQASVPIAMTGGYDVVGLDQFQGGLLAGRHLRDAGARDVLFIGANERDGDPHLRPTSQLRFEGLVAGLGRSLEPGRIFLQPYTSQFLGVKAARHFLTLSPRPDAIFAVTDDAAVSFQIGMMTHGLTPRRDYQLVGFDGSEQGRQVAGGPLTTVEAPAALMGRRGGELLRARLQHRTAPPTRVLLGCNLYLGQTTRHA
jgi:DNA-binding LacI/PurR family transcriptional regulator